MTNPIRLVRWSKCVDSEGQPMLEIGGGHYPQSVAKKIARDILQILEAPQSPTEVHECRECGHRIMSDEKLCCPHNLKTPPLRVAS